MTEVGVRAFPRDIDRCLHPSACVPLGLEREVQKKRSVTMLRGRAARRGRQRHSGKRWTALRIQREGEKSPTEDGIIDIGDLDEEGICRRMESGTEGDLIELLSDSDEWADGEDDRMEDAINAEEPHPEIIDVDMSPLTVDLTDSKEPNVGMLFEHERIYFDFAQSSSSDDYVSSDNSDAESTIDSDSSTDDRRVSTLAVPKLTHHDLARKTTLDICALEDRKPWRFVYRCVELPFQSNPRTDKCGFFFERWDDFWNLHGRAVWERSYWKTLPAKTLEYNQRKHRQANAARAFRDIANDLYHHYGRKLLLRVKSEPHSGWWYRSQKPINLVRLRQQDSTMYALHLSRYLERWPFGVSQVRLCGNPEWCLTKHDH